MQYDKLLNGLTRDGSSGNYSYKLLDTESANKPVTYINFLDAARFTNWLNNGKGNGSTESGAYNISTGQITGAWRSSDGKTTWQAKGNFDFQVGDEAQMSGLFGSGFDICSTITSIEKAGEYTYFTTKNVNPIAQGASSGPVSEFGYGFNGKGAFTVVSATHSSNAKYWIPTENEWYKAAYYNPTLNDGKGGYYKWATQSDEKPGNTKGDLANQANIRTDKGFSNSLFSPFSQKPDPYSGPNLLTAVGSFTKSGSYYGTFDQDGNITEYNESLYDPTALFGQYNAANNGDRDIRGASFYRANGSDERNDGLPPNFAGYGKGFRLASASPLSVSTAQLLAKDTDSPSARKPSGEGTKPKLTETLASMGDKQPLIYSGILSSNNEIWTTKTQATGTIRLTLNPEKTEANYELNILGLDLGKYYDGQPRTSDPEDDVVGMHFHYAPFFTVGDPAIGLINPNQESDLKISYNEKTSIWTLTGKWTEADKSVLSLKDSLKYIYAGELYVNIHTERVVLGEIRAQFNPEGGPGSTTSTILDYLKSIGPYTFNYNGDGVNHAEAHNTKHVDDCCNVDNCCSDGAHQAKSLSINSTVIAATNTVKAERLVDSLTGLRLITTDVSEAAILATKGWTNEGIAFELGDPGKGPLGSYRQIFRLGNKSNGDQLLTTNTDEVIFANSNGYLTEGVIGCIQVDALPGVGTSVTRLFNGVNHFYTSSDVETAAFLRAGWQNEGVLGFIT
jgi:hypothetical protein